MTFRIIIKRTSAVMLGSLLLGIFIVGIGACYVYFG